MNSLDLGEMWHGSTIESLHEIDRETCGSLMYRLVISGEKTKMADFMIPSTVKLKLLFEIIDSFFFVFFFHKKIEIEIN